MVWSHASREEVHATKEGETLREEPDSTDLPLKTGGKAKAKRKESTVKKIERGWEEKEPKSSLGRKKLEGNNRFSLEN